MFPYFTAFRQFKPRAGSSMIFGSPDRFPRILPGFLAHQVVGFLIIMELILHQSPFPHPDKQARDQDHMLAGPRNGLLSRPVVDGILHQGLKIIRGILYFSRQPALRTSNAVDQDHFSGIRKGCPPFYTAQFLIAQIHILHSSSPFRALSVPGCRQAARPGHTHAHAVLGTNGHIRSRSHLL